MDVEVKVEGVDEPLDPHATIVRARTEIERANDSITPLVLDGRAVVALVYERVSTLTDGGIGVLRPIELFRAIHDQTQERLVEIFHWKQGQISLARGVRSQEEQGAFPEGTDPGAPAVHGLGKKLVWTTLISAVVFGIFYWAYVTRVIPFDDLVTLWGLLKR